jgi:hypothetical protein
MKQIKFALLGFGLLGVIAIFALPFISMGPISFTLWKIREADSGAVYITLLGFLAGAVAGGLAVAGKQLLRWQAIVGIVGFLLAFIKVRDGLTGTGSGIGAKIMFFSALLGAIAAIVGAAKPEPKA